MISWLGLLDFWGASLCEGNKTLLSLDDIITFLKMVYQVDKVLGFPISYNLSKRSFFMGRDRFNTWYRWNSDCHLGSWKWLALRGRVTALCLSHFQTREEHIHHQIKFRFFKVQIEIIFILFREYIFLEMFVFIFNLN